MSNILSRIYGKQKIASSLEELDLSQLTLSELAALAEEMEGDEEEEKVASVMEALADTEEGQMAIYLGRLQAHGYADELSKLAGAEDEDDYEYFEVDPNQLTVGEMDELAAQGFEIVGGAEKVASVLGQGSAAPSRLRELLTFAQTRQANQTIRRLKGARRDLAKSEPGLNRVLDRRHNKEVNTYIGNLRKHRAKETAKSLGIYGAAAAVPGVPTAVALRRRKKNK